MTEPRDAQGERTPALAPFRLVNRDRVSLGRLETQSLKGSILVVHVPVRGLRVQQSEPACEGAPAILAPRYLLLLNAWHTHHP